VVVAVVIILKAPLEVPAVVEEVIMMVALETLVVTLPLKVMLVPPLGGL
jgi:hypothetical protein